MAREIPGTNGFPAGLPRPTGRSTAKTAGPVAKTVGFITAVAVMVSVLMISTAIDTVIFALALNTVGNFHLSLANLVGLSIVSILTIETIKRNNS